MSSNINFETSKADGGAHHYLQKLVGDWRGTTRVWFEPGQLGDESPVKGTVRSILGERFVLFEYEGSMQGKPITGHMLLGHNLQRGKFQMTWVDSFHTGTAILNCEGERAENGFWVLGHYDAPEGPPWGWRTEVAVGDDGAFVVKMYNITPDGEEALGVQMDLKSA